MPRKNCNINKICFN